MPTLRPIGSESDDESSHFKRRGTDATLLNCHFVFGSPARESQEFDARLSCGVPGIRSGRQIRAARGIHQAEWQRLHNAATCTNTMTYGDFTEQATTVRHPVRKTFLRFSLTPLRSRATHQNTLRSRATHQNMPATNTIAQSRVPPIRPIRPFGRLPASAPKVRHSLCRARQGPDTSDSTAKAQRANTSPVYRPSGPSRVIQFENRWLTPPAADVSTFQALNGVVPPSGTH
jgi:hypothetical protein